VIEATYDGGTLDGSAAITCHAYGTGTAYYSSTMLRPESLDRWLREIRERLGIKPVLGVEAIEGVEIVVRRGREADYVFVLNHEIERVLVRGPGYDLLTSTSAKNGLEVSRGEVAVLRTTDASPDGGWVVSR
jgi:beta-galactosidase